jgi:DNA-binding XRE family transcriptional regulator
VSVFIDPETGELVRDETTAVKEPGVPMTPIDEIVWDPKIYPREKWSTATIERYAEAILAGDQFPALIVETGTMRLLDGKHRLEAYKKAGVTEVAVEQRPVPEGMSARYFAATLSARHGDRMSNADLKKLAEEEFEADPSMSQKEWAKRLGLSESTVSRWVSHITERERRSRSVKAWRLTKLGWTQAEAGQRMGVSQQTVALDTKESHLQVLGSRLGANWNEKGLAQEAERLDLPLTEAWAAILDGKTDEERLQALGIKIQPYDVWQFPGCHDLMGDRHPGRIPGELVCHVLYNYTEQGDLVVDPMAGSGTTLDACLLMGRKARSYDIDDRHARIDVEPWNLDDGWPDTVAKASLVFWDPPYFDKMDSSTIGDDGYIDGSISKLDPDAYLAWFEARFMQLHTQAPQARLAFLMSDWDPENAKRYADHPGIYLWDYADALRRAGYRITRQIQTPLSTQQVHPDIVNKFRASRRMARLGRWLLICEAK